MNVRFDTLDYANAMEAAGIPRPHADLVDKELVTRDFLRSELAVLKSDVASQIAGVKAELRDEIRTEVGRLELQIRALQFGGAIAAFALGAVVLLTRIL
jgi:hypothetical protein